MNKWTMITEVNQRLQNCHLKLLMLIKRHSEQISTMLQLIQQEVKDFEISLEAKLEELQERQFLECEKISETQRIEILELRAIQEKEIVKEETMHDTEMKALLERKILDSILNTVDDGIINISPIETLLRFNQAAEKMFGWTAALKC